jgi:hypothetical protein
MRHDTDPAAAALAFGCTLGALKDSADSLNFLFAYHLGFPGRGMLQSVVERYHFVHGFRPSSGLGHHLADIYHRPQGVSIKETTGRLGRQSWAEGYDWFDKKELNIFQPQYFGSIHFPDLVPGLTAW